MPADQGKMCNFSQGVRDNGGQDAPARQESPATVSTYASRNSGHPAGELTARPLTNWAWLPVPILLAITLIFWTANRPGTYESNWAVFVLNLVFSTISSALIAYLIGCSFLARSSPGLLLLGCGVILWGCAGVVGSAISRDFNTIVAIHNSCVFLSALCHLTGAILSFKPRHATAGSVVILPAVYLLAIAAVAVVAAAELAGWMPVFFISGRGGTPFRQTILELSVFMFAVTSLLLMLNNRQQSKFTYWYGLALALIAVGLVGVLMQSARGSLLNWTGRLTQALSGVYMIVAAAASVRSSRAWRIPLEEELRESEWRLNVFAKTTFAGIVISRDAIVIEANDQFARMYGYEPGEVIGKRIIDFLIPPDHKRALDAINNSTEQLIEFCGLKKDGSEFFGEAHGSTLNYGGRKYRITVLRDISQQKQAQDELRKLNSELEQRVAERTAVAEKRADQLRALTAELTMAEQNEKKKLAHLLHDHLQQLLAASKLKMSLLMDNVKDQSTVDSLTEIIDLTTQSIKCSRDLSIELSPPALNEAGLSAGLKWLVQWFREKHSLEIAFTCRPEIKNELPEDVKHFVFNAAREMLFNVVKHAGVGKAIMKLTHRAGWLYLSVTDGGIGLSRADMHKMYSGFGLFSIKERIELLGGTLRLAGKTGTGTTALIKLPVQLRPRHEIVKLKSPAPVKTTRNLFTISRKKIRVLIADDHHAMRQGLAAMLDRHSDIEIVAHASDGETAVKLAAEHGPDVAVLDVNMPGLSGIEAARRIRQNCPDTCIVGLSMHPGGDIEQEMRAAGAVAYCIKDNSPHHLLEAIRSAAKGE
jgi:PAS domain S-box-containing protein